MKYFLLVIDVDGTLIDVHNEDIKRTHKNWIQYIDPRVVQAIKDISHKVHISLCTGRSYSGINEIIQILELKDFFHAVESGATVINGYNKIQYTTTFPKDLVSTIIQCIHTSTYEYFICEDGNWYNDINAPRGGNISSLSIQTKTVEQTSRTLETLIPFKDTLHIAQATNDTFIDGASIMITSKNATKKEAIEYIQQRLHISKEQTIGIGDMMNDIPMFDAVGLKCAMGNAPRELQLLADFIAPSVNNAGVAKVIETYLM